MELEQIRGKQLYYIKVLQYDKIKKMTNSGELLNDIMEKSRITTAYKSD